MMIATAANFERRLPTCGWWGL